MARRVHHSGYDPGKSATNRPGVNRPSRAVSIRGQTRTRRTEHLRFRRHISAVQRVHNATIGNDQCLLGPPTRTAAVNFGLGIHLPIDSAADYSGLAAKTITRSHSAFVSSRRTLGPHPRFRTYPPSRIARHPPVHTSRRKQLKRKLRASAWVLGRRYAKESSSAGPRCAFVSWRAEALALTPRREQHVPDGSGLGDIDPISFVTATLCLTVVPRPWPGVGGDIMRFCVGATESPTGVLGGVRVRFCMPSEQQCQRTLGTPVRRTSVLPARGHQKSWWAVS